VLVTLGHRGVLTVTAEHAVHAHALSVSAVDPTGAGDAFIGSLAQFLASGCEELEAIRRANLYAALSTLRAGTQSSFVTRAEFKAEWVRSKDSASPVPPPEST
jgi:ribokinase